MPSVRITEDNPSLATLRPSWVTAVYSSMDGIGGMGSLHEAGDALVAVAQAHESGTTILGSGVMIGPGLLLTATHVLDEFPESGVPPFFLTFLQGAARAWLPRDRSTLTGPSSFAEDRRQISDVTLISCSLNSDAYSDHPLTLAPLQVALPLLGERLWAFGYRHGAIEDGAALITPLVTSGLVTDVFPHGRGERMPASCIEVAMDTKGGMSGGPVVNANGDLVGIVTSSFDGGPSYITLIWDALRLKVRSVLPSLSGRGDIDLFTARDLGMVRLKGEARRRRRGDVVLTLSNEEANLFAKSIDPNVLAQARGVTGKHLESSQLESLEEQWSRHMEREAAEAAIGYLTHLSLPTARRFLASPSIPAVCLTSIQSFRVEDLEGLEDPEILSAREQEGTIIVSYAFELQTVVWTANVSTADYRAHARSFDEHFLNIEIDGEITRLETMQRCYFEAELELDQRAGEFTSASIERAGVMRFKPRS